MCMFFLNECESKQKNFARRAGTSPLRSPTLSARATRCATNRQRLRRNCNFSRRRLHSLQFPPLKLPRHFDLLLLQQKFPPFAEMFL